MATIRVLEQQQVFIERLEGLGATVDVVDDESGTMVHVTRSGATFTVQALTLSLAIEEVIAESKRLWPELGKENVSANG